MQTGITAKIIADIALLLITLALGFTLHKTGKPYQQLILALHKIGTLGFGVLIAILMVHQLKLQNGDALLVVCSIIAGISLIALIASGALLSAETTRCDAKSSQDNYCSASIKYSRNFL